MTSGKPKDDTQKEEAKPKKGDKAKETKAPQLKAPTKRLEGVKGIVRLAEADLEGTRKTGHALMKIRGVGKTLSKVMADVSGIDPNKMIGTLTDEEAKRLEDIILHPGKYGIPAFLLNRRSDPETGEDLHKTSSELIFVKKNDIDSMKKMQCYKGVRHQFGLPVRGQRTRSSFRTGGGIGVVKKKEQPKKGGAAAATAPPVQKKK